MYYEEHDNKKYSSLINKESLSLNSLKLLIILPKEGWRKSANKNELIMNMPWIIIKIILAYTSAISKLTHNGKQN